MTGYVVVLEASSVRIGVYDEVFDTVSEAEEFAASPPEAWAPRSQDRLVIYAVTEVAGCLTVTRDAVTVGVMSLLPSKDGK